MLLSKIKSMASGRIITKDADTDLNSKISAARAKLFEASKAENKRQPGGEEKRAQAQKELEDLLNQTKDSKTRDGQPPSPEVVSKWVPQAPASLKSHKMWSPADYAYFREKGYSDAEVKAFWDRDAKSGNGPQTWEKARPF